MSAVATRTPENAHAVVPLPGAELLLAVFVHASTPMLITDGRGIITHANKAFERVTGYGLPELRGQRPSLMRSHLQTDEFYRTMWTSLMIQQRWQGEIWNRRKDGRLFREWLSIAALPGGAGEPRHYLGTYSGLSMAQHDDAQALVMSAVDTVTGLLNRRAFIDAAQKLHVSLGRLAIFTLDIDRFTEMNEQFGLSFGDQVLRQVALRCTQFAASMGGRCVVGRVGPDEFALAWAAEPPLLASSASAATVAQQAARLRESVARSSELELGGAMVVTVSLGVAMLDPLADGVGAKPGSAAEALLHASAARHEATVGDECLQHYESQDGQRRMARALREAILADRIDIALQPKVCLRTGALLGLEALARWTGPDGEPVPPSEFIALAERRGLIGELGDRVLDRSLGQMADWRAAGLTEVPVAVNFSAPQFHRRDMAVRIKQSLARHGLPPELLEVELTESILLGDADTALETLQTLRQTGIGLALDDFGTGYSSLSYLRRFPVSRLKIDRSFVTGIASDADLRHIVQAVITLAHQFGMRCVAEGVETIEELACLRAMGCDEGQGYVFARPMPANTVTEYLRDPTPWAALIAASAQS